MANSVTSLVGFPYSIPYISVPVKSINQCRAPIHQYTYNYRINSNKYNIIDIIIYNIVHGNKSVSYRVWSSGGSPG